MLHPLTGVPMAMAGSFDKRRRVVDHGVDLPIGDSWSCDFQAEVE